jgi:Bacterial type II and III secretion system protein
MRFLLFFSFFYFNVLATDTYHYTLQELALTVSETNHINIVIDTKVNSEKLFYFNDKLDKSLSFNTFIYMLKDIDYNISYNGHFYYITKNEIDLPKFYYANNPNISSKKLLVLSKEFDVDLSMSDSSQIVVKYIKHKHLDNFKEYLSNYKPVKHVYLQGEILAVNETELKDIGIDFASITSIIKNTGKFDLGLFSNINNNDSVKKIISSHGITTLGDISVFISLLEATGSSKIVTRPNMLIRSGDKSNFRSGKQIRIITGSTDSIRNTGEYSSKQYEMLDLGLILTCSADIYNDIIDLDFSFSIKDINTYQPALDTLIIDNKSYTSKVSLKNNDSVILAGLTSSVKQVNSYSIPLISDIPVIGNIFKHDTDSTNSISYLIYFKATIQ